MLSTAGDGREYKLRVLYLSGKAHACPEKRIRDIFEFSGCPSQSRNHVAKVRWQGRGGEERWGTLWEEESAFHNPLATMTMARGKHHSTLCHHLGHHDGDHFDDDNDH